MVLRVKIGSIPYLPHIAHTNGRLGLVFRFLKRRQQYAHQDGYDGHYDQKLYQRKPR